MGSVYFAQAVTGGPIKIGYTAGDPQKRLAQLQTSSPYELRITRSFEGTHDDEQKLHWLCEKYRLKGEWFRAVPAVAEIADAIAEEGDETVAYPETIQKLRREAAKIDPNETIGDGRISASHFKSQRDVLEGLAWEQCWERSRKEAAAA